MSASLLVPAEPTHVFSPVERADQRRELIDRIADVVIAAGSRGAEQPAWGAISARQLANAVTRRVMDKTREAVLAG